MRERTDYLKGIAILAVVLGHWLPNITPEEYLVGGNGLVSFFFFLSGYGNYFSFRGSTQSQSYPKGTALFFFKKFIRLYPLYWIALLPRFISTTFENPELVAFALNWTDPALYWFVPAILLCYLSTPLLQATINCGKVATIGLALVFITVGIAAYSTDFSMPRVWSYRSILFNGVFIYYLGIVFAKHESAITFNFPSALCAGSFLLLMFLCFEARHGHLPIPHHTIIMGYLVTVTSIATCIVTMKSTFPLMGLKPIAYIGAYTYGVYLMHPYLFRIIHKIDLSEWPATAVLLLLFPVFCLATTKGEAVLGTITTRYLQSPILNSLARSR